MSSSTHALGQWPGAPLAMVVSQVRYMNSHELDFQSVAARIQSAMPGVFPVQEHISVISVSIDAGGMNIQHPSGTLVGFDLRSEDRRRSIRIQSDVITYHTSDYRDFATFSAEWAQILAALCNGQHIMTTRLGLRYIDFILPSQGRTPEDYLVTGFGKSPDVLGEQSPIAYSLFDYDRGDGQRLVIQYARGYGPPSLPPDLQESVPPPPFLVSQYTGGLSAVLDMDRWVQREEGMEASDIASRFDAMHQDTSETFRRIITPFAKDEWQRRQNGRDHVQDQ